MATIRKPTRIVPISKKAVVLKPVASTGRKLNKKQRGQVKQMLHRNAPNKFLDNSSNNNPTPTGIVGKITMPGQGDTETTRDGDQCNLVKLHVNIGALGADSTNFVRVIFFRWRDNDTTAPVINDVMQTATPGALGQYNFYNIQSGRVRILSDDRLAFSLNGPNAVNYQRNFYGKRLGKKKITFNPGATTGPDMIYYCLISDSVAVSHPFVGLDWRLEFEEA